MLDGSLPPIGASEAAPKSNKALLDQLGQSWNEARPDHPRPNPSLPSGVPVRPWQCIGRRSARVACRAMAGVASCVAADTIVIMQAANTGLTGGSTPDGNDYDREIVIISTLRMKTIHLIGEGRQVVCLPGATLNQLEQILHAMERQPAPGDRIVVPRRFSLRRHKQQLRRRAHSTRPGLHRNDPLRAGGCARQPELGQSSRDQPGQRPEAILSKLEQGKFSDFDINWDAGDGHDRDYARHVREIDADTPSRFNADPRRWRDGRARGKAGALCGTS